MWDVLAVAMLTLGMVVGIIMHALFVRTESRDLSMDSTRYWALTETRARLKPLRFMVKRGYD